MGVMAGDSSFDGSAATPAMVAEALSVLTLSGHDTHPDDVPRLIADAAALLGARNVAFLIVDLRQLVLIPLGTGPRGSVVEGEPVAIDGSIAGRAYRSETMVSTAVDGGVELAVPVNDSATRLGVLCLTFDVVDPGVERAVKAFASMVGEYVVAKTRLGDRLLVARRRQRVTLPAEMRLALLPPLTFYSPWLTISGLLEPAYDIAGDAFDYALSGDIAHLAVFDAMGHGLRASRMANLAISTYRNTRRAGADLAEMYVAIDEAFVDQFDDYVFVTGILATLDLTTGALRVLNIGHPLPLLLRDGRVVHALDCPPTVPAGLGGPVNAIAEHRLQPGDAVVLYTDGVTEARATSGEMFGLDRLSDHIGRAVAAHEPPAESLRRLMAGILEHHEDRLQDDATVLFAHWLGRREHDS